MDRVVAGLVIALIVAILFALMLLGWRTRRRSQSDLPTPASAPADLAGVTRREDVLYVATTRAEQPLDRVAVAGLGFRARAQVTIADAGVALHLAGRDPILIPRTDLVGAGRATWTIDRVVNRDGLVFLRWRLGDALIDSYVRPADPAGLVDAVDALLPAASTPTSGDN